MQPMPKVWPTFNRVVKLPITIVLLLFKLLSQRGY